MRIAIQSHPDYGHHNLPHQGMWFVFMLMLLMMLLSALVSAGDVSLPV
jgi:hypothetical protein